MAEPVYVANTDANEKKPALDYPSPPASAASSTSANGAQATSLDGLSPEDKDLLATFKVDQKCFCLSDGLFYEAKVKKYYTVCGQLLLLLHFEGWNQRHDETLTLADARERLLPYDEQTLDALERNNKLAKNEATRTFEIERIVKWRVRNRRTEFLIKWCGYDDESWEPVSGIRHTEPYKEWKAQRDLESGKSHSPARSSRSNTPRTSTPVSRTSTPLRGAGTAKQREMKRKRPTASAMAADVRRSTRPRRAARYISGSTSHDDSFVSAEGSEGDLDQQPSGSGLNGPKKSRRERSPTPKKQHSVSEEPKQEQPTEETPESPMSHASTVEMDEERRASAEVEEPEPVRDESRVMTVTLHISELTPAVEEWFDATHKIPQIKIVSMIHEATDSDQ